MNERTLRAVRTRTVGTAQRAMRGSNRRVGTRRITRQGGCRRLQIIRTSLPSILLKAAACIAYPWFFALAKVSRRLSNLCS
jgi:hypothetical protein